MTDQPKLQGTAARGLALEAIDEAFKMNVCGLFNRLVTGEIGDQKTAKARFGKGLFIASVAYGEAIDAVMKTHDIGLMGAHVENPGKS